MKLTEKSKQKDCEILMNEEAVVHMSDSVISKYFELEE